MGEREVASSDLLRRVVAAADVADLVDDMMATLRTEMGTQLRDLSGPDLRSLCDSTVRTLLRCIAGVRQLSELELETVVRSGIGRLVPELSLHTGIRFAQASNRALRRRLVDGLTAMDISPQERTDLAARLGAATLMLSSQITATTAHAYLTGPRDISGGREADRSILDLLEGRADAPEVTPGPLREAGFVPGAAHIVVVAAPRAGQDEMDLDEVAEAVRARLDRGARRPLVVVGEDQVVGILSVDGQGGEASWAADRLRHVASHAPIVVAVGRAEPGIGGIERSYAQAQATIELLRGSGSPAAVLGYDESLPYLLLRNVPQLAAEVYRSTIAPLLHADPEASERLVDTIRAYLAEGGNLSEAGKDLSVHRATLYRRIDRIAEVTGKRLDDPGQALLFALGLRVMDLLGHGPVRRKHG